MSFKQLMQRGAASPPLHPHIADHYLTSYGRDFRLPPVDAKRNGSTGAAGFPTPHTAESICLPGADHAEKHHTENHTVSHLNSSPVPAAVAPPCERGDACVSQLTNAQENPRRYQTTYGDEFNGVNSVRNPVAEHHQCCTPPGTAVPTSPAALNFYPHASRPIHLSQKNRTLCGTSSASETFAAINTFKTTYEEKFNDASSIRALVPPSSCADNRLITAPKFGPPCWGVSEQPPPYVPGSEFTYPGEKPFTRHVDKSTTHASYQHRTRKHEVMSYDAGGDAVSRSSPTTDPTDCITKNVTAAAAAARDSNKSQTINTGVLQDENKSKAVTQFSGTNPSATAPRRYRLYEALQALDRRHDSFALAAGIDEEKRKVEAEAAAKMQPQPSSTKPTLHDMFENCQKAMPSRDACGVNGELCGVYGDVCPLYGGVPYAGLDAFHESVNKFAPIKSTTSTKVPYCKPWQPLTKVIHPDAEPKNFEFTPPPIAGSDGFIPVCPTARHDGKVSGRKRKDWKPEGCTVQA